MKKLLLIATLIIMSTSLFAKEVWVATNGKQSGNGTKKSPVATIEQAIALLSESYKGEPFDEATIWLKSGTYKQLSPVVINPSLFGGNNVKLTITSEGKNKAQITGGHSIDASKLRKVSDAATLKRLNSEAADKIMVVNLKGTGLESAFAQNTKSGTAWDYRGENYSLVSWGADLLQVAQWPNRGYAHISEVIDEGPTTRWLKPGEKPAEYSHGNPNGAKFKVREKEDLSSWITEMESSEDILLQGFVHNDWYYQQEKVGAVNSEHIELLRHTRYGVVMSQKDLPRRVRFVNLLCELDEPGEWYYDNITKEFFVYPIEKISSKTAITILGGGKMFQIDDMEGLSIENIIFENGGALALEMNCSSNSAIRGCVFRNFTGRAFNISGGKNSGIQSCDFYGLNSVGVLSADFKGDRSADTGLHIDAEGESRKTLQPCGHYMVNNHIYDCRLHGYGLVGLNGVGVRFAHNVIHDTNGGVTFSGNDIILEYNEFYNMGWEMGDWNVAYIGADWASFGNEVRYNFVHHLMETPGAYPVEGFRNDDNGMGVEFHGNYFYKSGRGCVAFSGAGNGCYNNIALETSTVYQAHLATLTSDDIKALWNHKKQYDDGLLVRGDKDDNLWRAEQFYGKMGWNFEPYRSKYPKLKMIMDDANPFAPSYSVIKNNYISREDVQKGFYIHRNTPDAFPATTDWEYPMTISMDVFENLDVLDLTLKSDFKPAEDFVVTDFSKIGMYDDEYRVAPDKDQYRKEIKDYYKDVRSNGGRYDMDEAYKRYPVPAYLKK